MIVWPANGNASGRLAGISADSGSLVALFAPDLVRVYDELVVRLGLEKPFTGGMIFSGVFQDSLWHN